MVVVDWCVGRLGEEEGRGASLLLLLFACVYDGDMRNLEGGRVLLCWVDGCMGGWVDYRMLCFRRRGGGGTISVWRWEYGLVDCGYGN